MKFHATGAEVLEHRYQVAQTAAQPVELPNDERIAVFQFLQTAQKGTALRRGSRQSLVTLDRDRIRCSYRQAAVESGIHWLPARCHLDKCRSAMRPLVKCRRVEVGSVWPHERSDFSIERNPVE